ncbi:sensor histidine kinase [Actinacidiphila soli]|uniref:sensor histidine kinase n=1 Tax=Actinacidiphila soli TaxID=2487275 RepID=UPI000FCCB7E8|nr:nitrate- and nitrite sensing domain-containing protein [Actinacidiphila soli]
MRFRGTTIRRKIVALLLVPLLSLTALWAFAAALTGSQVWGMLGITQTVDNLAHPVEASVQAIQNERRAALVYLADPRRSDAKTALQRREDTTDKAVSLLRTQAGSSDNRGRLDSESKRRLDLVTKGYAILDALRAKVADGGISRLDAYDAYNATVDPCYAFMAALSPIDNTTIDRQIQSLTTIVRAGDDISREDALMAAAITAGRTSAAEQRAFTFAVAEHRAYYRDNADRLGSQERSLFDDFWNGTDGRSLTTAEDSVIAAGTGGSPRAADRAAWQKTASAALADLRGISNQARDIQKNRTHPYAVRLVIQAAVAGGLGLVAVIATLVVSTRVARGLIRDLSRLRKEAQEVSGTRLPRVMRRLAAGEEVDVETEAPRLQYSEDEVGQVGKALNTLQRAAVEAAVRQALMRRGVSEVFVNLARRSQVLLHRQLTLLDAMERRTEDTRELADLFRLDHMTTRMRRHAEGLVILSGAAPSRQWRKPVQLMDVVRAAVSEVEDYERVEVRRLPRLAVTGPAVADLTHLIAELIENATVFSPPHTTVQVHGEPVANGFALEIDDRGLGLTPDAMLEANLRLAETPEFELSDTDRLGLFVVSRLAQRQSVRVSLRPSPYGGTTAVVLIPSPLLAEGGEDTGGFRTGELELAKALGDVPDDEPVGTERSFRQWGLARDEQLGATPGLPAGGEPPREHSRTLHPAVPAQAADDQDGLSVLPRRRRPPVLVADNGRPVDTIPRQGGPAGRTDARQAEPEPAPAPQALPRRVRQASLAPQLRADATEETAGPPAQAQGNGESRERSPEEVRARMASIQSGWQRGRRHSDEGPDVTPATPAPRTITEGNGP